MKEMLNIDLFPTPVNVLFVLQGDKLEMVILNSTGTRREYMDLRLD